MILRILGALLLGGGALGAASGWALIKYLDSRQRWKKERDRLRPSRALTGPPSFEWPPRPLNMQQKIEAYHRELKRKIDEERP